MRYRRPLTPDRRPPTAGEPDAATKVKVEAAYGKLPLSFEANQGQSNEQVKFLSCGRGYTLFLTSTEAVLALHKSEPKAKGKKQRAKGKREEQEKTDLAKLETQNSQLETVVRMKLVGTNPTPQVAGLEELPGKSNYFVGNDPSKWRTNIPHYAKVKYEGIYPGIDLIYYGNQQQLEYDFVVAPGADPKTIQLAFEGLVGAHDRAPLQIDDQGDLILQTAGGELRQRKPLIYQEINGTKQAIPGRYVLLPLPAGEGRGEGKHQVGFQVAAYDVSKPLVIDPVLSYSTYLGGSSREAFSGLDGGIAVDSSGNAYVTGSTRSDDFPLENPFQATLGVSDDAFVTKLNAAGSALVYSTYLGGSDIDRGHDIAVDTSGNAYVTGETFSTDFPTLSPFDTTLGGSRDAFVAKIAEITATADLSITKTDSPDPVTVGSNLTYTLTVTNNGPDAATGVVVTDTLPGSVTFVSSSPSQGTCSGTSTLTCDLGDLANGASATVTIVVTPTVVGKISNTATVTASETDPDTANNTATAVTRVKRPRR